ncbi:MAG: aminopeptidase P family protein [Ilumatobacter sp.]|nr:aminopeptidase P family protein [Ilumatobacter sp.]
MNVPIVPAPPVDVGRLRAHRVGRLREQLAEHDVDAIVLTNPVSLRYAADWREYALFQAHIPTYYLVMDSDGRLTMFGAYATDHPTIDEFRAAHHPNVFDGGLDTEATAAGFADDIAGVVGTGARLAVERVNPTCVDALRCHGFDVVDAEPLVEIARSIKSTDEIICIRHAIAVAEAAITTMRERAVPGLSENELMATLHQVNIANDGDWIDGRMLCSGERTNPWYQEASSRRLRAGEFLAFDTDMIGPFGYCADISRTWVVGDGEPTAEQRDRYRRAHDEIDQFADLLAPGRSFRELSDAAMRQPDEFVAHRYACLAHGVGMSDEWPRIHHRCDWDAHGYDGEVRADMVLSVESFVGSDRGGPGVKLEQMYLVGERGASPLSTYPYEHALLASP